MPLRVESRIYVLTHNGQREIQLCLGDITQLPLEEKVDVILVSAFPNNYGATKGSVLGALKNKLGLSVENLARNHRKEDLRSTCSCWISQPLPDNLPYRQLICFERVRMRGGESLLAQVKEVFRAMMPVFNNENKSVITPLLATGSQQANREAMLSTMVGAAAEWMRMGLPLQCLKIVIYTPHAAKNSKYESQAVTTFNQLKANIEKKTKIPVAPTVTTDIFLIYSEEDIDLAKQVKVMLTRARKGVRIVSIRELRVKVDSWQHNVYTSMVASARVVPLLTEAFLRDTECIDQYNVALCCNRRTRRHLVAPMCMDRCTMPTYMALVQYLNCKPRDAGRMQSACESLADAVCSPDVSTTDNMSYDVFISYSHRNLDQAKIVMKHLQDINPHLKIFFDYDELKTGVSWQQTLYRAIDGSRCLLALISPDYLKSPVCSEELNLALTRHLSKASDMLLIPICIRDVELQSFFTRVQPITAEEDDFDDVVRGACKSVCHFLETEERDITFSQVAEILDIDDIASSRRQKIFEHNYEMKNGNINLKETEQIENDPSAEVNIYASFMLSDQKYAYLLEKLLKQKNSNINFKSSNHGNKVEDIETAEVLIVLLSKKYLKSKKEMEELTLMLSRARSCSASLLHVITLEQLPPKPTYVHLVACETNLDDDFWQDVGEGELSAEVGELVRGVETNHGKIGRSQVCALMKAACDVIMAISKHSLPSLSGQQRGVLSNIVDLNEEILADSIPHIVAAIELSEPTEDAEDESWEPGCHGDLEEGGMAGDLKPSEQEKESPTQEIRETRNNEETEANSVVVQNDHKNDNVDVKINKSDSMPERSALQVGSDESKTEIKPDLESPENTPSLDKCNTQGGMRANGKSSSCILI